MKKLAILAVAMLSYAAASAQFIVEKKDGSTFEINGNVTFTYSEAESSFSVGESYDAANDLSEIQSITYSAAVAPKVGDYYYQDGTFSSEYDATSGKKVIGVIFYVGNPSVDDAALASDRPECVHGLVVGLKERKCEWQDNYGEFDSEVDMTVGEWIADNTDYPSIESGTGLNDPINKIVGYSNTLGIDAFNDGDYGWDYEVLVGGYVSSLMSSYKAPAESSGWYIPSAKELSLLVSGPTDENVDDIGYLDEPMVANLALVNQKLEDVTGATTISGVYWTSNESTVTQVFTLQTRNALLMETSKGGSNSLRPILAF